MIVLARLRIGCQDAVFFRPKKKMGVVRMLVLTIMLADIIPYGSELSSIIA